MSMHVKKEDISEIIMKKLRRSSLVHKIKKKIRRAITDRAKANDNNKKPRS